MTITLRWLNAWPLVCALACGGAADGARTAAASGVGHAPDVVSTVNDAVIHADELRELANSAGLSAAEALRRLQAERLLEQEAERRGYAGDSTSQRLARQALVQALLERDVESEPVSDAEVASAYAGAVSRFERPEKRTSTHLLARLPNAPTPEQERAAHDFADYACKQLLAASDVPATLEELQHETSPLFSVVMEKLPAVAQRGAFVPAFSEALFSLPGTGVVPHPVRSEFGFHVIIVTAITPAEPTPLEAAQATLRRELATRKRERRLASLLATLASHTPVRYSDAGPAALAALEL
jgi:PPIC-type PPIASE domain